MKRELKSLVSLNVVLASSALIGAIYLVQRHHDLSELPVGDPTKVTQVTWKDAERMVRRGKITYAIQSHSLWVTLQDAQKCIYQTTEPKIDMIIHLAREVDPSGKKILVGAE